MFTLIIIFNTLIIFSTQWARAIGGMNPFRLNYLFGEILVWRPPDQPDLFLRPWFGLSLLAKILLQNSKCGNRHDSFDVAVTAQQSWPAVSTSVGCIPRDFSKYFWTFLDGGEITREVIGNRKNEVARGVMCVHFYREQRHDSKTSNFAKFVNEITTYLVQLQK